MTREIRIDFINLSIKILITFSENIQTVGFWKKSS